MWGRLSPLKASIRIITGAWKGNAFAKYMLKLLVNPLVVIAITTVIGILLTMIVTTKYYASNVTDMVKATQTNVGKVLQVTSGLYKWWVVAIVVIINILVLLSLRGARQTVIVQTPQPVQSAPVQPNALPCENVQPKLEKSDEMKIF